MNDREPAAIMSLSELTLGIEEEYQIIDPETRELAPYGDQLAERGSELLGEQIKPEMIQSQVEVGTRACASIDEARAEIVHLRRTLTGLAAEQNLRIVAAGTHPFSRWHDQSITPKRRYNQLANDLRDVARRLLTCGMHVHIGIPSRELRIDVLNQACYFIPHILALSASSPFWGGRDTGLKSYRSMVAENMPRSGIPPSFRSWNEHQDYVAMLIDTDCLDEATKIWWDIRPHSEFPTLEFRMSDVCTRVDEAMAIAALLLALVGKLIRLRRDNRSLHSYRHHLITENKWRAVRDGLGGMLVDFDKRREVPTRGLIRELLVVVDDVVDELGVRREIDDIERILQGGSSADRQLATYRESGDLNVVVDQLIAESQEGCS